MAELEGKLYLSGMVLFSICIVGVLAWFAVSYHNWRATRAQAYGCGTRRSTPLSPSLQRYHGGVDGHSMYIDLQMESYDAKTMGRHQGGTISLCFCGLGTTAGCSKGRRCSAYQASKIPVTYDLDSCVLNIPLGAPCLQSALRAAFPSVTTLEGIIYDRPKNVFHIEAHGLKAVTENVTLVPVDPNTTHPCAACTVEGVAKEFC
jgi:hypothetical protein